MFKFSFAFLLLSLGFTFTMQAQSSRFLSELKTIISAGEKGTMATLKGELEASTRDREEQHRVYSCLQPLTGFDINFSEKETYFSLFIVSQKADSAKMYIDALLNNEIRERSGISGYTVNRENYSLTNSVILQKTGSPVTVTIQRPDSKILIAFSIKVMKNTVPPTVKMISSPVVTKNALPLQVKSTINKTPLFLQQLKTILEAADKGMASHKVKLVYTTEDGTKNYTCNLVLEGFKTYIIDDGDGLLFFAEPVDLKLSAVNAKKFIDKKQREDAGIMGYTTTFKVLAPGNILRADEETSFDKPGNFLFIKVFKNSLNSGYRIEIKEIVMG